MFQFAFEPAQMHTEPEFIFCPNNLVKNHKYGEHCILSDCTWLLDLYTRNFTTSWIFFVPFESLILTQQFRVSWWNQLPNNFKSLSSFLTNCFFSNHNFGHLCQAFRHDPRRYLNVSDHYLTLSHTPHILWAPSRRIYHQCLQQIFFLKAFSM